MRRISASYRYIEGPHWTPVDLVTHAKHIVSREMQREAHASGEKLGEISYEFEREDITIGESVAILVVVIGRADTL
jgi:hypothetical protein